MLHVAYLWMSANFRFLQRNREHTTTQWRVRLRRIYDRDSRREDLAINDTLSVQASCQQRENKTESKHHRQNG